MDWIMGPIADLLLGFVSGGREELLGSALEWFIFLLTPPFTLYLLP